MSFSSPKWILPLLFPYFSSPLVAIDVVNTAEHVSHFESFTGSVTGDRVRLRLLPSLEGQIVKELHRDDVIKVVGETEDFYIVEAYRYTKGYIFRKYILDGLIEGSNVNVRSLPQIDAPILTQVQTGTPVSGVICQDNSKWLEVTPPSEILLYVAKQFVRNIGPANLYEEQNRTEKDFEIDYRGLQLYIQEELNKEYPKVDFENFQQELQLLLKKYEGSSEKEHLLKKQAAYFENHFLQKKCLYLEDKEAEANTTSDITHIELSDSTQQSIQTVTKHPTAAMKTWLAQEETLYRTWQGKHIAQHKATIDDWYQEQVASSKNIEGIIERYQTPTKNKPGDFLILGEAGVPIAYLYSTRIDLHQFLGQKIKLIVTDRDNHHFAFPAYFVLAVAEE